MKKILTIIGLNLFGVLFAFVLIECAFRLFASAPRARWNDRPKEYYIHEASKSFQDYPHAAQKPANTYRIAVIGDSFTFAPYMQFDDAFPKKLERMLNLNEGVRRVEVINYGVPAYSTSHEVPVVDRAIDEGADFILMQITFNDPEIKPYTPQQLFRERNKFGELQLEGALYKYWTTLGFVRRRLHNNETHLNYVKKFFDLFEKPKTWANFSDSWRKIVARAEARKVPLAAVVFPLYGIPLDAKYPFHPIHEKVQTFLNSLNVRSTDLYRTFEGIPLERIQVIVGEDFHPNEIGHRLAAEAILRWLRSEQLIPGELIPKVFSNERIGIRKPGMPEKSPPTPLAAPGIDDEGNVVTDE